jgi:hypothetical protein
MKSKMLFFGLLFSLLMSNAVHSTDYQIDKFNLDLHAGRIASYLWQGEKVPAEEIDRVCNSVIRTARNSDASADSLGGFSQSSEIIASERDTANAAALSSEIETMIGDFLEVTEDAAEERSKRKKLSPDSLKSSLQLFVDQIRKAQHDLHILQMVCDAAAEAYC